MADKSLVKNLIEAGIHFGHRTSGWNPKMAPYIYAKKNGIHIVDVRQTIKGLLLAKKFITRTVADGKDVLFVGTKRQARPAIENNCKEVEQPYVTERWLGGTLTNFRTIRSRLHRLEELEALMSGEDWVNYSKKMASQLQRERRKIDRNLGGIRGMDKLPGAIVVVDVRREGNALKEAHTLGIPTVCLLDTDGDPDLVDIPIPGNDDAMRAIDIIMAELTAAVAEGKTARAQKQRAAESAEQETEQGRPRRSARAQFRASEPESEPTPAADEPETSEASDSTQPGAAAPDVASDASADADVPETKSAASDVPTDQTVEASKPA